MHACVAKDFKGENNLFNQSDFPHIIKHTVTHNINK